MVEKLKVEQISDGKFVSNRNCTDCLMILLFIAFLAGWGVIAGVAFANGRPIRIVLPTNYRGNLCGDGPLTDYSNLYIPLPSHYTYGICVPSCPMQLDYVCNNDATAKTGYPGQTVVNSYYSQTSYEFSAGPSAVAACIVPTLSSCTNATYEAAQRYIGLTSRLTTYDCFLVLYTSYPTLYRCLPLNPNTQNLTIASTYNESASSVSSLTGLVTAGQFFDRGFGEVKSAWLVILICCGTACVVSLIWVYLLRFLLAPVIYTCLLLVLAVLIGIGFVCRREAQDLANVQLPGDDQTDQQEQIWIVFEYLAFLLAIAYFFFVVWLLKRIRIGMELMKEGGKAFLCAPYLVVVPPIVCVLLVGVAAFFAALCIYIQTLGSISNSAFTSAASNLFGNSTVSAITHAVNTTASGNSSASHAAAGLNNFNVSAFSVSETIKILHAYNFFGFLWVANYFILEGFFVTSMVTCIWYFSASAADVQRYEAGDKDNGKTKHVPFGSVLRAFIISIRYHLGSILFGSFLIALVQFIQALVLYIEREYLRKYKDNVTVKILICLLNCILACIEKTVKLINKNSIILICIKNCNFCSGCISSVAILLSNAVRVGTLASMVAVTTFILKVFICTCNTILGFALLHDSALIMYTPIQSGLFPLISIFLLSYIIASIFLNVYESCVDTVMMCFFVDEGDLEGAFMPESLAKLVGMFAQAEEARRKYEEEVAKVGKHVEVAKDKH